nr:hypothetical protein [Tanacetum cinerariifolium]
MELSRGLYFHTLRVNLKILIKGRHFIHVLQLPFHLNKHQNTDQTWSSVRAICFYISSPPPHTVITIIPEPSSTSTYSIPSLFIKGSKKIPKMKGTVQSVYYEDVVMNVMAITVPAKGLTATGGFRRNDGRIQRMLQGIF